MSEHDLDRLIDSAAEQMVARDPSDSLGARVLSRVRERQMEEGPRRRVFVWATAAASVALLCGTVAILITRSPVPTQPASAPAQSIVLQPPAAPVDQGVPVPSPPSPSQDRAPIVAAVAEPALRPMRLPPPEVSSVIEPLEAEPIVLSAIEVPLLEQETHSIARIEIEALTIEPLTASND